MRSIVIYRCVLKQVENSLRTTEVDIDTCSQVRKSNKFN